MRKFKNKSTLRKKVNSKWKILSYAKERQWEKNKPFKHLLKLSLLPIHEGSVLNTCWSALNTYTTFFDPTCPIQPDSFIPTALHCLKPSFHLPCSKASWIQMDAGPETAERGRPKSTTQSESTSEQDIVSSATPASRGKEICMQLNAIARLMNKKNSYW